jgi:hypothetical protein
MWTFSMQALALAIQMAGSAGFAESTPGLTVKAVGPNGAAPKCRGMDAHLLEVQKRVWLRWVQMRRPRNLGRYGVEHPPQDKGTPDSRPLPNPSLAEQKAIWDTWAGDVIIAVRVSAHGSEASDGPRPAVSDFRTTKSGGNKIVDNAAVEAIVAARGRLLAGCLEDYEAEFTFTPWREPSISIDPAIAALSNDSPVTRELAAGALGAMGPEAQRAIDALERATRDSSVAVQHAAEDALTSIRGHVER